MTQQDKEDMRSRVVHTRLNTGKTKKDKEKLKLRDNKTKRTRGQGLYIQHQTQATPMTKKDKEKLKLRDRGGFKCVIFNCFPKNRGPL